MAKKTRPRRAKTVDRELTLGDPVMLGATKFRVKDIDGDTAHVKMSFGKRTESVLAADLYFDKEVHLWRLHRPHCTKCKNLMLHFIEGNTDTWICSNPDCTLFDYHLSTSCPACETLRVKNGDMFVCLNPECPTYKGDILGNDEVADLEEQVRAQREASQTALEDATRRRAKPGQGTQAAARRRREAKAKLKAAVVSDDDKAIDEAFSEDLAARTGAKVSVKGAGPAMRHLRDSLKQSRITLPDVQRQPIDVKVERYRHVATELVFQRRVPEAGKEDKLKAMGPEDRRNAIAKRLKGSRWNGMTAHGVADEISRVMDGEKIAGVEHEVEDVPYIEWRSSFWSFRIKEESWAGDKGKKSKWLKKFIRKGKAGDADSTAAAKAAHEEARGEIRIFVQDRMKKMKGKLVDGEMFEYAFVALYAKILKEVNPDDDDDPSPKASGEEWLSAALPDKAPA